MKRVKIVTTWESTHEIDVPDDFTDKGATHWPEELEQIHNVSTDATLVDWRIADEFDEYK